MANVKTSTIGNAVYLLVSGLNKRQANMIAGLTIQRFPGNHYKVSSIIFGNDFDGYEVRLDFFANMKKDFSIPTEADIDFINEHINEFKTATRKIKEEETSNRFARISESVENVNSKKGSKNVSK